MKVLREAGLSLRLIAEKAGIAVSTVRRILEHEEVPESDRPCVGRPPVARRYQDIARRILADRSDLPTVEILRLLREKGYDGGKNPVYRLVRELRHATNPVMVRFEGLAGEFSQNDFGQVRVKYLNGETEIVHFFAARLKWSRWVYVETVPNEQVEALSRALISSFESFGGVPLSCVFDNPKTIVTSRYGHRIEWNPTFQQVVVDYRFACEMCTPKRGNEKGSVENLVGFVKGNFFKVRRFHDREDLLRQLASWHQEVNYERPCRATRVTPASRIEEERKRLRPLPIPPSEYALRFPVRVGPTAEVSFQGRRYSMPAEAMGLNATLFLYPERVRIMTDRFDEVHPRDPSNGVSTLSKHATSALATVAGRRGQLYYMRQRVLEVGSVAERFLTEVVHAHPRAWSWDVEQLFALLQQHGPVRMAQAFQEALDRSWFTSEAVEHWLREHA
ncbi:Integrase, catalytic region, partial [mine drainage metagenome]